MKSIPGHIVREYLDSEHSGALKTVTVRSEIILKPYTHPVTKIVLAAGIATIIGGYLWLMWKNEWQPALCTALESVISMINSFIT